MKSWIALEMAIALTALSACAPTETGNPSLTTTGLTLTAYSSDPSRIAIEGAAGASSVDQMWLSVASIDLDACDGQPAVTAVAGPFVEDLVPAPHPVHALDTKLDRFCGLSMGTIQAAHDLDGGPSQLIGQTIVIHGQRSDAVPFLLVSARVATLVLHVPDGVAVADEPRRFLLAFDLAQAFASLDLSSAVVGGDGTIDIDSSDNAALLSAFEASIDGSISLHHDLDRDGVLDPNESAHINH